MDTEKTTVGWREWISIPGLGISSLKAKIDSGAKTSALHAWYVEPFEKDGEPWIKFGLHTNQGETETSIDCEAPVFDQRNVTDSGGHTEQRYVILTEIILGNEQFETEMTLTNRDTMRFRMLVGRNTLNDRFLIDPVQSFLLGEPDEQSLSSGNDEDSASDED